MIERRHRDGATASRALYSDCERYRYLLSRDWSAAGGRILFVMLNPSTADEIRNDPTIARCERRARDAGCSGYAIGNLFGWRATRPADLRAAADPIGPENDACLRAAAAAADRIVCAWGVHGAFRGRGAAVERLLRATGRPLLHLGLTKDGYPRHPLYLAGTVRPLPWEAALPQPG